MKNTKSNGPGRPKYTPYIPKGKFTFAEFMAANGVNPDTGKGDNCTVLTLRKFIARDRFSLKDNGKVDTSKPRRNSLLILIKDEVAEPDNKAGLGRKGFVYQLRAGAVAPVPTPEQPAVVPSTPVPAKTGKTGNGKGKGKRKGKKNTTTADYEATKAALLGATPVVTVPSQDAPVTVAPEAPVTVTAPVEDPAPTATATATETPVTPETVSAPAVETPSELVPA